MIYRTLRSFSRGIINRLTRLGTFLSLDFYHSARSSIRGGLEMILKYRV